MFGRKLTGTIILTLKRTAYQKVRKFPSPNPLSQNSKEIETSVPLSLGNDLVAEKKVQAGKVITVVEKAKPKKTFDENVKETENEFNYNMSKTGQDLRWKDLSDQERADLIAKRLLVKELDEQASKKRREKLMKKHQKKRTKKEARSARLLLKAMTPKTGKNKTRSMQMAERTVTNLLRSPEAKNYITRFAVPDDIYDKEVDTFLQSFSDVTNMELTHSEVILPLRQNKPVKELIFRSFLRHLYQNVPPHVLLKFNRIVEATNLESPRKLFHADGSFSRNILIHFGPQTDMRMKTAMDRFKEVESAIYLCSSSMRAKEFSNLVKDENDVVVCNDYEPVKIGKKMCGTAELAHIDRDYDVAVIDDFEMIEDAERGWAWTRAFYGLKAKEIHILCRQYSVSIVENLSLRSPDQISYVKYEDARTRVTDNVLKSLKNVTRGDCVIAFSRSSIFQLKKVIETCTVHKCAVIYEGLPEDIIEKQCELFNDPTSGYDVLLSTQMIINAPHLNIKRMIAYSMDRFLGNGISPVSTREFPKIFESTSGKSVSTTIFASDVARLRKNFSAKQPEIEFANIRPNVSQFSKFAEILSNEKYPDIVKMSQTSTFVANYLNATVSRQATKIGIELANIPLSFHEWHTLSSAPVPLLRGSATRRDVLALNCEKEIEVDSPDRLYMHDEIFMNRYLEIAQHVADNEEYKLESLVNKDLVRDVMDGTLVAENDKSLRPFEILHSLVMFYIWLSVRFPLNFTTVAEAKLLKSKLEDLISKSLGAMKFEGPLQSGKLGKPLRSEDDEEDPDWPLNIQPPVIAPEDLAKVNPISFIKSEFYRVKQENKKFSGMNWKMIDKEKLEKAMEGFKA